MCVRVGISIDLLPQHDTVHTLGAIWFCCCCSRCRISPTRPATPTVLSSGQSIDQQDSFQLLLLGPASPLHSIEPRDGTSQSDGDQNGRCDGAACFVNLSMTMGRHNTGRVLSELKEGEVIKTGLPEDTRVNTSHVWAFKWKKAEGLVENKGVKSLRCISWQQWKNRRTAQIKHTKWEFSQSQFEKEKIHTDTFTLLTVCWQLWTLTPYQKHTTLQHRIIPSCTIYLPVARIPGLCRLLEGHFLKAAVECIETSNIHCS